MIKNILLALLLLPFVCILMIVIAGLVGVASFYIIRYFVIVAVIVTLIWLFIECSKDSEK